MYGSRDMESNRYNFFVILDGFLRFYSLWTQKIKILKKWKNPEDIIILQMCTIYESHVMYGSWDTECNRQNFLSFWTIFCPLPPPSPNNPKNQSFQKMKKTPRDIITLHMCAINENDMMYGSWDMECDGQDFLLF